MSDYQLNMEPNEEKENRISGEGIHHISDSKLKKQVRSIDLALIAGRKRQSPRTGFVHLFPGDDSIHDVIPMYENFCFVLSLFRQKTAESVKEGKEILEKLLAFQIAEGNFPLFLHDYPKCYDANMGLKVAPILIYILKFFSTVLGEQTLIIESALKKTLAERPKKLSWENRYRACVGEPLMPVETAHFSSSDWIQWIITAQLAGINDFSIPYNRTLQTFLGPSQFDIQEKGEPEPNPIEWLLAEGGYLPRLSKDHQRQLLCAPLFPLKNNATVNEPISISLIPSFRLLWGQSILHSLILLGGSPVKNGEVVFHLPEEIPVGRDDLFEAVAFCNISSETELFVEGKKATVFKFGERVTIQTPERSIHLMFELISGKGDFSGRIYRANRPSQISCKGSLSYEAFDWKIGMRTLRRSEACQIKISIHINGSQ